MSIFKKLGNAAKGAVSSVGKTLNNGTAFVDKNGKQITGGLMVVGGAVATATGLGAAVGVPLMAAGVGVATAKSSKEALAAGATGVVSAASASPQVANWKGSIATKLTGQANKLIGSETAKEITGKVESFSQSGGIKAITGSALFKMHPPQVNALSKLLPENVRSLPNTMENFSIGGLSKLAGNNPAVTVADAAQMSSIVNALPDANASQVAQISNLQKNTKMNTVLEFAKKNWIWLLVAGVAVAAYFLFFRKKKGTRKY